MNSCIHSACYIFFEFLVFYKLSGAVSAKGASDDSEFNARSSYGRPVDITLVRGYVDSLIGCYFAVLNIGHYTVDIGLEVIGIQVCKLEIGVDINKIEGSLAYYDNLIGVERS